MIKDVAVDFRKSTVESIQWIKAPIENVFSFFSDPYNLEKITPPFLKFHVVGVSTPQIQEGTELKYWLKVHGIPVFWKSRIENWKPPYFFSDRQLKGPYRAWFHMHEFSKKDGGTLIRDFVEFKTPLDFLKYTPFIAWVARDLENIFEYRRKTIACIFDNKNAR